MHGKLHGSSPLIQMRTPSILLPGLVDNQRVNRVAKNDMGLSLVINSSCSHMFPSTQNAKTIISSQCGGCCQQNITCILSSPNVLLSLQAFSSTERPEYNVESQKESSMQMAGIRAAWGMPEGCLCAEHTTGDDAHQPSIQLKPTCRSHTHPAQDHCRLCTDCSRAALSGTGPARLSQLGASWINLQQLSAWYS